MSFYYDSMTYGKFLINFMIDSTKISILLCLTIIVTSILVMSYNEYVNRFSIIATQDNGIYIFDKKSATLNKCENDKCILIQTNFPQNQLLQSSNKEQPVQQYATNVTPLPNINQNQQQQNYNNQSNPQQYNNTQYNDNNNQENNNNSQQQPPQVTVVNSRNINNPE